MSDRKRAAEYQITRDDDDCDGRDDRPKEVFQTTPSLADEAEMAQRRVVKVKRAAAPANPPSSGGFFKGVAGAPTPGAPAFSFGAPAAKKDDDASASKPPATTFSFGAAPAVAGAATTPSSFTFGAPAASGEAPKMSFSFGTPSATAAKTEDKADSATASKPATGGFSFGAPAASTGNTKFSFGFAPAAEKKDGEGAKPAAEASKPMFGSGSGFNFSAAVGSFAEAQKKLSETHTATASGDKADEKAADAKGADGEDEDDAPKLFAGKSAIATVSGEVLASGPGKLYIFVKDENKWKEHGEGDVKVKKDVVPAEGEGAKEETTVHRLMVRDGYSLNATVAKGAFVLSKEAEKHIIFSIPEEKGVATYLLKFTGPTAEATAKKVTEEIKKFVDAPKAA